MFLKVFFLILLYYTSVINIKIGMYKRGTEGRREKGSRKEGRRRRKGGEKKSDRKEEKQGREGGRKGKKRQIGREKGKKIIPRIYHTELVLLAIMLKYFLNHHHPSYSPQGTERNSAFSSKVLTSFRMPHPALVELTSHPQVLEKTSWGLRVQTFLSFSLLM